MDYQEIRYGPAEGAGPGVVQVTLDRPAALNAYTSQMCEELTDALLRYARDEDARVLVLTGAGRAFCAGGDVASQVEVEEAARRQLGHGVVMRERMHVLAQALYKMDKPVIAMINGPAVAGGLMLALLCDFRVAAASARLGDTSGRAGLLPDEGGAWIFPRIMGIAAATRMTLLSELYDAPTALGLGLVTEVVPHDRLLPRAVELAGQIAEVPAPIMAGLKEIYVTGSAAVTDPALAAEQAIAGAQTLDRDGLKERFAEISARNRGQIQQP